MLCCEMVTSTSVACCGVVHAVLEISSRRLHLQSFNHGNNIIISVPMDTAPIRCLAMFRINVLDYSLQPESSVDAHGNDFSALL
jgi:hypothetical protein